MIPYFRFDVIHLGPISIYVWGTMVALGILAAIIVAARSAKKSGLDPAFIWDAAFGMVVWAFIGARVVHVVGYFLPFYLQNPIEILKVWHGGLSASGGIIGAALYFLYYVHKKKKDFWEYGDHIAYAFPLGYGIGRIGCFLIHDHPGTLSHFVLAVRYPGGARHDLGLYLSISGWLAFIVFVCLKKIKPKNGWPKGFFTAAFFLWYGLSRFLLDFLRAYDLPGSDARYGGLTVAQYFGIVLILMGIYKLVTIFYGPRNKTV